MYNDTFSKIQDVLETLEADITAAFEHPEEDSLKEMRRVLMLSDRACMLYPLIAKLDTILSNVLLSPIERLRWMELLCKLMALHEQSRDLLLRSIALRENMTKCKYPLPKRSAPGLPKRPGVFRS